MKRAFRHGMGTIAASRPISLLSAAAAILVVASASAPAMPDHLPDHLPDGPPGGTLPLSRQQLPEADGGALKDGRIGGSIRESRPPRRAPLPWSVPAGLVDGIPATVLRAYQHAAATAAVQSPACRLPMALLAAIGQVETGHARGGWVDKHGTTVRPIIGPVLDGRGLAMIPDTDDGRLDGDPMWDHAVGPMQFIPQTWAKWAADGNGDGRATPHNVFDASLAAANYLCADNRDLGTPAGLRAAILTYNHSDNYLNLVLAWMNAYAGRVTALPDAGPRPNIVAVRPVRPLVQVAHRPATPAPAQIAPAPPPSHPDSGPVPALDANPSPAPQAEVPSPAPPAEERPTEERPVSLLPGSEARPPHPDPDVSCDLQDLQDLLAAFAESSAAPCPCTVPPLAPASAENPAALPLPPQFADILGRCPGIPPGIAPPEVLHRWPGGLAEMVDHLMHAAAQER